MNDPDGDSVFDLVFAANQNRMPSQSAEPRRIPRLLTRPNLAVDFGIHYDQGVRLRSRPPALPPSLSNLYSLSVSLRLQCQVNTVEESINAAMDYIIDRPIQFPDVWSRNDDVSIELNAILAARERERQTCYEAKPVQMRKYSAKEAIKSNELNEIPNPKIISDHYLSPSLDKSIHPASNGKDNSGTSDTDSITTIRPSDSISILTNDGSCLSFGMKPEHEELLASTPRACIISHAPSFATEVNHTLHPAFKSTNIQIEGTLTPKAGYANLSTINANSHMNDAQNDLALGVIDANATTRPRSVSPIVGAGSDQDIGWLSDGTSNDAQSEQSMSSSPYSALLRVAMPSNLTIPKTTPTKKGFFNSLKTSFATPLSSKYANVPTKITIPTSVTSPSTPTVLTPSTQYFQGSSAFQAAPKSPSETLRARPASYNQPTISEVQPSQSSDLHTNLNGKKHIVLNESLSNENSSFSNRFSIEFYNKADEATKESYAKQRVSCQRGKSYHPLPSSDTAGRLLRSVRLPVPHPSIIMLPTMHSIVLSIQIMTVCGTQKTSAATLIMATASSAMLRAVR